MRDSQCVKNSIYVLFSVFINLAKKVRKHCIDEHISQCRFGVEPLGVYQ